MSIEWITKAKVIEQSGLSKRIIEETLSTGEVKFAKNTKQKTGRVLIHVPSWNDFWDKKCLIK